MRALIPAGKLAAIGHVVMFEWKRPSSGRIARK